MELFNTKNRAHLPALIIPVFILLTGCSSGHIVYHGHSYPVIETDRQYWMAENLATKKYCNGKPVKLIDNDSVWAEMQSAGCTMYNNSDSLASIYGFLYNWRAVETGKLCPSGWHVATDEDWLALGDYLGGEKRAGGRMRSATHWKMKVPNGDDIGFRALPGGYKRDNSYGLGFRALFWSSTAADSLYSWGRRVEYDNNTLTSTLNERENGFAVRCVKDRMKKH